jgi:hypothetical protein
MTQEGAILALAGQLWSFLILVSEEQLTYKLLKITIVLVIISFGKNVAVFQVYFVDISSGRFLESVCHENWSAFINEQASLTQEDSRESK